MDIALREQIDYYRARAGEYDQWFLREGRYDRGAENNALWFAEVESTAAALECFSPTGDVLELACGTGIWTEQLARHAAHITAVDASPEVLEINRGRVRHDAIDHITADIFTWEPERRYDVVFFGFWLSHVPPDRFESFWEKVRRALRPGGRFFLVDSLREETSTAADHVLPAEESATLTRRLNDGREFRIYKVFHQPDELRGRLQRMGWDAEVETTGRYFLLAHGRDCLSPAHTI